MTVFNVLGITLVALGSYYCLDRKPDRDVPELPPVIELGNWKVIWYLEKDQTTMWRKIYKSGVEIQTEMVWRSGQGFLKPEQKIEEEFKR